MEAAHASPEPQGRRAALLRVGALAVGIGVLVVAARAAGLDPSPTRIRELGATLGDLGVVLFVPLGVVLSCLFVPSPVICGAAGLLFGTLVGTAVALPAIVLSAGTQVLLTRTVGGPGLERLIPARLRGLDAFLERRGLLAVIYIRLVPGLPFVSANYAAGLTRLRVRDMLGGTALGKGPRIWAYVALGGNLDDLGSPQGRLAAGLLVVLFVVGTLLGGRQLLAERRAGGGGASKDEGAPSLPT